METVQNNESIFPQSSLDEMQIEGPNVRLTSAEVANLWAAYMSSSMKERVLQYFLAKVEDAEIRAVLEYTLHLARIHIAALKEIYKREEHLIPLAFTENDVNTNAPRLFSDEYFLRHLEHLAEIKFNGYATALLMSARTDIRKFFTECVSSTTELYNKTSSVMLSKGLLMRAPFTPMPDKVDYVEKQGFLTGYFRARRPLTTIEVSHLFSGISRNYVRKALFTGFSQVVKSEDVRSYMLRGKEISNKHIEILSTHLIKNDLPLSMVWDPGVIDSDVSPFSEKLIIQAIIRSSNVVNIAEYGKALSVSLRNDIAVTFTRLMAEAGKFAQDGVNIMIDNDWLEEPPLAKKTNKSKHFH